MDPNYDEIVPRIQQVYSSCSKAEQQMLKQILSELADTGYSYTYEQLFLADFTEMPVSVAEFISSYRYLGNVTSGGDSVYPFWKDTLSDVFEHGNKYNEIVLSGATRIGKTSTMVTILCYMLYRLMIYRDPHAYFKKKQVSRFTIAFANLNEKLAAGVAYREYNDTLKECPWFMDHGKVSRSDRNFYYMPEGDQIDIVAGSDSSNFLGMQIWCLKGDTEILTQNGVQRIEDCAGTTQTIFQYTDGLLVPTVAEVQCTGYSDELIRIELEDGSVIEGTPDHRVMLTDGTYKCLKDLTSSDDLLTFNICEEVDEMNLKDKNARFTVYEHVSPEGKRYVGITSKEVQDRWQAGGKGYSANEHFWNAIQKYGWNNFQHNILAADLSFEDACAMEVALISKYDLMNPDKGYNHTSGGNWSCPDEVTRAKLSAAVKRSRQNPEVMRKISTSLKGHVVSDATRAKISAANTGRKFSEAECERRRQYVPSEETRAKLRGHIPWNKGLTAETDDRMRQLSDVMRAREFKEEWRSKLSEVRRAQYQNGYAPRWITNGLIETSIQAGDALPEGFQYGRLSVRDTYIHKGEESKKVSSSELTLYLQAGWEIGRPTSVGDTIRKSLQKMHWEYQGIRFESANLLAEYLNSHGYPDIVGSTVTSLYLKGFNTSPKYRSLDSKILKVLHEDKIDRTN